MKDIDFDERVATSRDKQVGLKLPLSIDQRLDALYHRAENAGERTSRRELVAALIFGTQLDGDALGQLLRTYRRALVRDALLDIDESKVVYIAPRPGPRVRSAHE